MATNIVSFILIWAGLAEGLVPTTCDQDSFESYVRGVCLPRFNKSMESSGYQDSCPWPDVKSHYHAVKNCVDRYTNLTATACRGWRQGSLVDGFFLEVHRTYFFHCGSQRVQDPPLTTAVLLIAPGIVVTLFLPLCVHRLTTWNTEMPGNFPH